jgi:hypothetical protein
MAIPRTQSDLLRCIAVETARMSYPGSMSRGIKPVVSGGTKAEVEGYFRDRFPIRGIWSSADVIAKNYDNWHRDRVDELAHHISSRVPPHNVAASVAAKFLNTFMHQLMKHEHARPLFRSLHLPLDARVFRALLPISSSSLSPLRELFEQSPYTLPYSRHGAIQEGLWRFVQELNERPHTDFRLTSRIELNWLWL